MNMNEYRSKLKIQNIIFLICTVVLIAVQILAYSGVISPISADSRWSDYWNGFIAGAAMGVSVIMIFGLIQNLRAMKNEKALKRLYTSKNDERKIEIYTRGKSAGVSVCLPCMLVSSIISGYFSITVSITVIVCVLALSLFMLGGKIYYSKKL